MAEYGSESTDSGWPEDRTIGVEGLPPEIDKELLELYFEDKKYGGGEIEYSYVGTQGEAWIAFKDVETVGTILEHGTHTYGGQELSIFPLPSSQESEVGNAVLVEGLDPGLDKDLVELFFENKKKSGGGIVERIQTYKQSGKAIIWFQDAIDAQEVLARRTLTFQGCQLAISPFIQEPRVKISGISDRIPEEAIELFFGNTRKSGGGEIKGVNVYSPMKMAIVTFEEPEVADRVVTQQSFTLAGCNLTAEYYYGLEPENIKTNKASVSIHAPQPVQRSHKQGRKLKEVEDVNQPTKTSHKQGRTPKEEVEIEYQQSSSSSEEDSFAEESSSEESDLESFTIEVRGVKQQTAQETVKKYFSNRNRSGGGKIETITYDESSDRYIITFIDREAVDRVLQRDVLKLDGAKLNVKEMYSASSRKDELKGPTEPDKVYVLGMNERITRDELELDLDEYADCEVDDIIYGLEPSVALVSFKEIPDYKKLQKALARKPVKGCMLSVAKVPKTTSLQVFNTGRISEEGLSAYFGNTRKSGGSGDVETEIHGDQDCAVVTFENSKILANVMKKSDHRYEGQTLRLEVYRERLGLIPVDHDTSQPCVQLPTDVIVSNLDKNITQYFKTTPKATDQMNNEMLKHHAEIDWDHQVDTELHVHCTLSKDDKDVTCLKKNWESKIKPAILLLMSDIGVEKRECLKKVWTDVCREVNKIKEANQDVAIVERDDEAAFYIVGPKEAASGIHHQVDQLCKEFEQKLHHIETTIELKVLERALLEKRDILRRFQEDHPKLKIALSEDGVELRGPARDLLETQTAINSFLRNLEKRTLHKSNGLFMFLSMMQEKDENPLENVLQQLNAVFDLKGDDIILFGVNEDIVRCEEILENDIKETMIEVSSEEQTAIRGDVWKQFLDGLFTQCKGMLYLELINGNTCINLVALLKDFHAALEEIKTHIRKNAVKKEFTEMDEATSKFIGRFMEAELKSIEHDFEGYSLKIVQQDDSSFCIFGTADGLSPAKQRLEKLQEKVTTDIHTVNTPGMPHYFTQQEAGKYFIKAQEDKYQVIVDYEDPNGTKEIAREIKKAIQRPTTREFEEVEYADVKIKAVVADMTSVRVDCIVNAANGHLQHSGTLAKAIADKGGRRIQEECNQYVRRNGPVMEGHAVVTGAGNLPCRKIIHAVGPVWNGGRIGEADLLYECVFSHILQIAVEGNFSSIAIPAISGGSFGMPIAVSTSMIVEAIKDFLDSNTDKGALSEICLVDAANDCVQEFAKAMKKKFKVTRPTRGMKKDVPKQSSQTKSFARKGTNGLETNEGMVVTIKKGTIAQEQVDMILNTVSPELTLSSGALSKSILEAAGPTIQDEVSKKFPNGLQPGEHVTSSGGNLRIEEIFHAVLCNYGQGSAKEAPKKLVFDFLKLATDNGYTTVALPAMGTGNLGFPRNLIADLMFNEVIEFSRECPDTSVKDVRFVLFDKDQQTIDAFEDRLSKLTSGVSQSSSQEFVTKSSSRRRIFKAKDSFEAMDEGEDEGAIGGTPESFEFLETGQVRGAGGEIQIGSIRLQVVEGDITKERTDAIVTGTNAQLSILRGGVSGAIAKAAGMRYTSELRQKGAIGRSGVAITDAGDLSVKHVFHIDVNEMQRKNSWKGGISKCLQEADRMGLTSLSFPALGTGNLGIDPETMADNKMEAIADFCRRNQNSNINLVRIVIYESSMVSTYVEQMDKATKPGSSIWGMVRGFARSVGSSMGLMSSRAKEVKKPEVRTIEVQKPVAYIAPMESPSLMFIIRGLKQENIDAVKREIDRCCTQESADNMIFDPKYSDIIKSLDQQQVRRLEQIGGRLGIRVTVDRGHKINRIRLQGLTKTVYQAESRVKDMLHNIMAEQMEESDSRMLEQFVQWEYEESNGRFQPYPTEINVLLEKAHNRMERTVKWQEKETDGRIITFVVNLNDLTEREGRKMKRVNRRQLKSGVTLELPKHWAPMNEQNAYELVEITIEDNEYSDVCSEFSKTSSAQIIKIERLQNKHQYKRYMVHKEDMEASKPKTVPYERRLWHGTSPDVINTINTNGFNRSYCGKHAVVYGQGVYFARDAKYSVNYSTPDMTGQKQMYLARVLTGDYERGDKTMKTPPSKNDPKNPSLHYDTTVNDVNDPSIFVIYYDTQAYPEYVVTFK